MKFVTFVLRFRCDLTCAVCYVVVVICCELV